FSTLVAQNAVAELKGTALTMVTCIGFAITIFSIQLLSFLTDYFNHPSVYMVLGIGPIIGLIAQFKNR
ncbi:MAG: MFS transporter, partial [Ekhidna sp.]